MVVTWLIIAAFAIVVFETSAPNASAERARTRIATTGDACR